MFPRQAIYRLLRHTGAYKSCTSGYRRAQLAKTLEYYKPINQIWENAMAADTTTNCQYWWYSIASAEKSFLTLFFRVSIDKLKEVWYTESGQMEYCPNIFQADRSVHLIKRVRWIIWYSELNCLTCLPMPAPLVDILIHTLSYPIKRIHFGA